MKSFLYIAWMAVVLCGISGCALPPDQSETADLGEARAFQDLALFRTQWTPFQFGPWLFAPETPVYGINTGVVSGLGNSAGLFLPLAVFFMVPTTVFRVRFTPAAMTVPA